MQMVRFKNGILCMLWTLLIVITACSDYHRSELPADQIRQWIDEFNGDVGVYVKDLETGSVIEINADTVFPTASMIKVPLMIAAFDKIELGDFEYHEEIEYGPDPEYEYSGDLISELQSGATVPLSQIIHLMMSISNNTGSLWIQYLAGTGSEVNRLMESYGMENTRVNSRTDGRSEAFSRYGWGQTTPREMATLAEMIYKGEMISEHASEQMYRIMTRNFGIRKRCQKFLLLFRLPLKTDPFVHRGQRWYWLTGLRVTISSA
jgi:beta-lactamase class A